MNRILCILGLAIATTLFAVSSAGATPIFELRVRSGTYDSGVIAGTIDPGGDTGSVSAAGLIAAGGGGNEFTVGAIDAAFGLTPQVTMDLGASGITHTSSTAGSIRIFLTLAGLTDPLTELLVTDIFSGSLVSAQSGTRSLIRVHAGDAPFSTDVLLFESDPIQSSDPGPGCSLITSLSFTCNFSADLASVPSDPYSLTAMIMLNFAAGTQGLSENVKQHLTAAVPEPGSLALLGSGMLAAWSFGRRRQKRPPA